MQKKILLALLLLALFISAFWGLSFNRSENNCVFSLNTKLNIAASKNAIPTVAYNNISLESGKRYLLETKYEWYGSSAQHGHFYFDLYIPGKWDKSKYNFIPPDLKCREGDHNFSKNFLLTAPQTSMYFRVVNISKGNIVLTKCKIKEISEFKYIVTKLVEIFNIPLLKYFLSIFVLLTIIYIIISRLNNRSVNVIIKFVFILSLAISVFNVIYNIYFIKLFGSNIPYLDDWYFVSLVNKLYHKNISLFDLFNQNGPHRPFVLNIITYCICALTKYNLKAILYTTQLLYLFIGILLFVKFAFDNYKNNYTNLLILFCPIVLMLFHIRQYEIMLWPMCIGIILTEFFALSTFFFITKINHNNQLNPLLFIISIITASLASFTYIHGIIVWPLALFILFYSSINRKKKLFYALTWIAIGSILIFFFFHGWNSNQIKSKPFTIENFILYIKYFVILIGGALCWDKTNAYAVGCILMPISVLTVFLTLLKTQLIKKNLFWVATFFYAIGILFMILRGRISTNFAMAITSRYAAYSLLLIISVYAILINNYFLTKRIYNLFIVFIIISLLFCSVYVSFNKGRLYASVFKSDLRLKEFSLKHYGKQQPTYIKKCLCIPDKTLKYALKIFDNNNWNIYSVSTTNNLNLDFYSLSTNSFFCRINIKSNEKLFVNLKNKRYLEIFGCAYDASTNSFDDLYIQVDSNKIHQAFYGIYSPKTAKIHNNNKIKFSKYYAAIPIEDLLSGNHKLNLYFIKQDNKFYNKQSLNFSVFNKYE